MGGLRDRMLRTLYPVGSYFYIPQMVEPIGPKDSRGFFPGRVVEDTRSPEEIVGGKWEKIGIGTWMRVK